MSYGYGQQQQQQPRKLREKIWNYEGEWQRDICGCCNDIGSCCCAYICCPCFCCRVFSRAGECMCTPFLCCWPDALMSLRMKIRTGFRLQGSIFKDCLAAICCPCCLLLQINSELEYQGL
ncbi:unnamed protein product [Rotaria sordida]|uniref:Uncharacterized protein n=1 Tax=Rotaria sordida TaxID=392033 RepID=A0A818N3X8_9BILA|nr:unnamed protein product [Rotaria sordida]CAF0868990.1 unnamed protein product [Rotaria sordida]CAF3599173.1 unnamed protein product [Rotaria sordida]